MPTPHDHPTPAELFARQLETLIELGYPAAAGMGERTFRRRLAPLAESLAEHTFDVAPGAHRAPFVIVVNRELVPIEESMRRTALPGGSGFIDMTGSDLSTYHPIEGAGVPLATPYVAVSLDTGAEFLNVAPSDALPSILGRGRSPITIEEGIALITHHPELLRKNACFSLAGSRCGDRRVPALWISNRRPKLGWCWNGNPHTWLGSASCESRIQCARAS